ncbi:MAG: hypothetical protein ACE37H_15405 [Phycisphaeraceae bacterium]
MGGLGSAIVIIIVITIWVIKGLQAVMNSGEDESSQRKRRSLEDWDELQARRRAEMARQRGEEPLEELYADANAGQPDPSQMTMAERIELARRRARQQQGGGVPQASDPAEALRLAQQRAEREAEQRRTQAQRDQAQRAQAERERAARERERQVAERRRKAEQRAQAEREQLRKSRSRHKRPVSGAKQAKAASRTAKLPVPAIAASSIGDKTGTARGASRLIEQGAGRRRKKTGVTLGPLDAASLRRAFVMKELLDKPLAMRNTQDELLS